MANETEGALGEQGFLKPVLAGCLDPSSAPHLLGLLRPPYTDPAKLEER